MIPSRPPRAAKAGELLPEALGFSTRYFDLSGLRMHAAVAGPESGPLVVLLHGFPEFWYSWRHQIGPLAEAGFRVLAPDQRGYNLSTKAPPYDTLTLAADIAALILACGRQRVLVAGHDWGAVVACVLAEHYPSLVERLAILNGPHPAAMVRTITGGNLRQLLRSWYVFLFQAPRLPEWWLSRSDFSVLRQMLIGTSPPGTFMPKDLERYRVAWSQPGVMGATVGWYRTALRPVLHLRGRATPPSIQVPALVLWGERDVALEVEVAEWTLDRLERGRLVRYPSAGHWVHQEHPEELSRQLIEFFAVE